MKIRQAVIPAAGLGTRFLPFTKSVPKELVPLMAKPAIQMIVEEGLASGVHSFTIIANKDKQAIINYFSPNLPLDTHLQSVNKTSAVQDINAIINAAQFTYIPQPEPLGLGHAILMAEHAINDDFFAVFLPDEIMMGIHPALAQLIAIACKYNASVIAVQEVPADSVCSYGIVAIEQELEPTVFEINHLVEKPSPDKAPSRLAIIGRYILSSHIFPALKNIKAGAGNEIQLTDGISEMMRAGNRVLACKVDTQRYDIGNPVGWLQANIACGLADQRYHDQLIEYLRSLV